MRWQLWIAFSGMCLLAGSELVLADVFPPGLPWLAGLAFRMGVIAVVTRLLVRESGSLRPQLELAGWAALLWVPLPALSVAAGGRVSGITELLVFSLVPIGAIFLQAQSAAGFGPETEGLNLLLPALAGFGGAALLLPYVIPESLAGRVWLAVMVAAALLAGVALVRVQAAARKVGLLQGIAAASAGMAVVSALLSRIGWSSFSFSASLFAVEAARLLLLDAPLLILALFLLRRMNVAGYSSRYFLVPLVAVAASIVGERPKLAWTDYAGIALILVGSWRLLHESGAPSQAVPESV